MHSSERRASALEWALVALSGACAAWVLACVLHAARGELADDAFITYRYGRNLAEGFGLRFNPSDPEPTWGASSLLHTLFAAAAHRLGAHPLIATRALSLAAFGALALAFGWTAARIARSTLPAALLAGIAVCTLWGLLPESATHLASGMDALLFTLVHGLAACWAALALARPTRWTALWGWLVLTLLALARPEGGLLALAYLLALAFAARIARADSGADANAPALRPLVAKLAVALLATLAAVALWRWSYFGQLQPNAYYVKVDSELFGGSTALLPGLETTARFLALRWLPLLGLVAVLAAALQLPRAQRLAALALLAPAALVVLGYSRAIHEMAAGFRYEFPMLAPLGLALVVALAALARRAPQRFAVTLALAGLALPALSGGSNPRWLVWLRHPRSLSTGWVRHVPVDNALARVGLDLAATGLGQEASILLSGAGQAPYYSNWRAIDWIGLNTARFSGREALSVEQLWAQIDQLAPDVCFSILPPAAPLSRSPEEDANWNSASVQETLRGRGSALFKHWDAARLAESFWREMLWIRERCEFGAAYKLGPAWGADWWVLVYVRRDSPHRQRVLDVLRSSPRADAQADLGQVFPFDPRLLGAPSLAGRR